MSDPIKSVAYYMDLPYSIILRKDTSGDFFAQIEELPGCLAHGDTETEALINVREAQQLWIEDCLESGQPVPEPEPEEELPSGKWLQRVPRTLHQRLTRLAKKEGVSLNQLVTSILATAASSSGLTRSLDVISAVPIPMQTDPWAQAWEDQRGPAAIFVVSASQIIPQGSLLTCVNNTERLIENAKDYDPKEIARHAPKTPAIARR